MQELFPEVQAAAAVLRERIRLLKAEIAPMKETVEAKEKLIRHWQHTLHQALPASEPDPYDFLFGLRPSPLISATSETTNAKGDRQCPKH